MTLNIRGRLLDLSTPIVMAIINATPDSFYEPSRVPASLPSTYASSSASSSSSLAFSSFPSSASSPSASAFASFPSPSVSPSPSSSSSSPSTSSSSSPSTSSSFSSPFSSPSLSGVSVLGGFPAEAPSPLTPSSSPVSLAARHLAEGATILDIGACSTRPGSIPVPEAEEIRRLDAVLPPIRAAFPDAIISIDTFRSAVVNHCSSLSAIDIINDISAGSMDPLIFQAAADLHLPYVLMHGYTPPSSLEPALSPSEPALPPSDVPPVSPSDTSPVSPSALEAAVPSAFPEGCSTSSRPFPSSPSPVTPTSLARFFASRLTALHDLGVSDVLLDPGFGFGKSSAESFAILHALPSLIRTFPDNPWLIGLSRKRLIYQNLGTTPAAALNGTTVLNTAALLAGAHILRVHDTRPAVEAITLLHHR